MTRKYTKDHEWVDVTGNIATVGITNYAQEQLGDVVYVELPDTGRMVKSAESIAVVESVKAASEVYAPLSGEIEESNNGLADNPETINSAPETSGWFFKIKMSNVSELDELLDEGSYKSFVEGL